MKVTDFTSSEMVCNVLADDTEERQSYVKALMTICGTVHELDFTAVLHITFITCTYCDVAVKLVRLVLIPQPRSFMW